MTAAAPTTTPTGEHAGESKGGGPGALRLVLIAVCVACLLVAAGAVGWLARGSSGSSASSAPSSSSVDAGFARDMSTHHTQAVTMAGFERDHTSDPTLRNLAYDIETEQQFQVGEMTGWLNVWGLARNSSTQMAWMGGHHMTMTATSLMPGMATQAQLAKFENSRGKAMDVLFLQLMIRHHQGGLGMAEYAMQHASLPAVRQLASSIISAQNSEIVQMEQYLRERGGSPLPSPAS